MVQITLSAELKSVVDDIAEVSDYLWEKGWAARNAGNVSVNVTNLIPTMSQKLPQFPKVAMNNIPAELAGHYFMVTTTGSRCRELAPEPQNSLLLVFIADSGDGYHILWGGVRQESRPTAK